MKLHRTISKVFGYECIKLKKQPSINANIINLIQYYDIDLVLDVGANYGQFGKMVRNEGFNGEIHSFEPVGEAYDRLDKACAKDEKWFAYRMALGDSSQEETINVVSGSLDLSSFLKPNEFGEGNYDAMKYSHQEQVKVETVDGFLASNISGFDKRKIFLKMDTQGYDLKVFQGAINSIKHISCMLSELSLIPIYSGMPYYLDALREYEKQGFVASGFYPVSRNDDLSVIEIDCVLINKK